MGNLEAEVQAWGRRLDERKSRLRWSAGRIAGEWESSAARKMEEAQEALFRKLERLWWKQEELKRRIERVTMNLQAVERRMAEQARRATGISFGRW